MSEISTTYRGYTVVVKGKYFTILDREGKALGIHTTHAAMRLHVRRLLRAEREKRARADA
jgi:hypothetical protein